MHKMDQLLKLLDGSQSKKLNEWMSYQDRIVKRSQGGDLPYYGTSGGGYTFSLTPTSLGLIYIVKNNITEEKIDLTDYTSW